MSTVTQENALATAQVFLNSPRVRGVEVIGSVAREKQGNDLDLVVVVDAAAYATYVLALSEAYDPFGSGDNFYGDYKSDRLEIALKTLKFGRALSGWLRLATTGFSLDVHLMPEGWRRNATEIQKHLPHHDPKFVSNIAKDAVGIRRVQTIAHGQVAVVKALWQ